MFDALVMGGASLLGGLMGSESAEDAASAQAQSSAASIGEERRQYNINRSDMAPYRDAGSAAVNRISDLLGIGPGSSVIKDPRYGQMRDAIYEKYNQAHIQQYGIPLAASQDTVNLEAVNKKIDDLALHQFQVENPEASQAAQGGDYGSLNKKFTVGDFYDDPVTKLGMEFGLNEGTKAINAGAGAAGLRNSGATLKALTKFGTDYAGTKAGESYNRFYGDQDRVFNRLSGVAGTGQTAATNTASMGAQTASNIGNTLTAAGNARGAASIAKGNAMSGALNTVGSWWNSNSQLDKILASRNSLPTSTPPINGSWQNNYSGGVWQ